ncbi:succinate dehydrogenase, hydrophobic membrane anchor protein [Chloroflexota bacterium]
MPDKKNSPNLGTRRGALSGGAPGWLLQRISAAIAFGIIITHLLVIEYTTPGEPITFTESVQRLQNPLFPSLWLILLGAGLYHALYGLRNVILDFFKIRNLKALTWTLFGFGIIVFVFGVFSLMPLILGKPLFGN